MRFYMPLLLWFGGAGVGIGQDLPRPPEFVDYTGPTVAFPGTDIGFTIAAGAFQTNSCGVSYDLVAAPTNASFYSFSERPPCEQFAFVSWQTPSREAVGTTNLFVVRATDYGTPPLSATTTVSIVVIDVPPIHLISMSNGERVLQFTNPFHQFGTAQNYLIESITNLSTTNWSQMWVALSNSPVVTISDTNARMPQRFYRVVPNGGWSWWPPAIGP